MIESLIVAASCGTIGVLWRISAQLACIKVELKYFRETVKDQEIRIRILEKD